MPDHNADVFKPPYVLPKTRSDRIVEIFLGGFRRWDAIYFLHIAEHGYSYENTLAFFPLFPFLVRLTANSIFFPLQYLMNYSSVIIVTATLVNIVFFVLATKALFELALHILKDEMLAFRAAQLFCINPASVFFSAAYSESSFAYLTFSGMLQVAKSHHKSAAVFFALSGASRSNGLINMGFIFYSKFLQLCASLSKIQRTQMHNIRSELISIICVLFKTLVSMVVYGVVCAAPFACYQFAAYLLYCDRSLKWNLPTHLLSYGSNRRYHTLYSGRASWCDDSPPLSYSYIQHKHWDLGFLNYFQVKQIPNFLLATPMVCICFYAAFTYFRHRPLFSLTLGLYDPTTALHKKTDGDLGSAFPSRGLDNSGFLSHGCYVHIIHMVALVTAAVLFMHVQVTTRFIASSCPIIYMFVAFITTPANQLRPVTRNLWDPPDISSISSSAGKHTNFSGGNENLRSSSGIHQEETTEEDEEEMDWDSSPINLSIFAYFLLYFFVGTAAFANFMPWT